MTTAHGSPTVMIRGSLSRLRGIAGTARQYAARQPAESCTTSVRATSIRTSPGVAPWSVLGARLRTSAPPFAAIGSRYPPVDRPRRVAVMTERSATEVFATQRCVRREVTSMNMHERFAPSKLVESVAAPSQRSWFGLLIRKLAAWVNDCADHYAIAAAYEHLSRLSDRELKD